jgi:hypothetical protein
MADYDAGAELISSSKGGEAIDKANSPISLTVPLVDFANANDGPSQEPKAARYRRVGRRLVRLSPLR